MKKINLYFLSSIIAVLIMAVVVVIIFFGVDDYSKSYSEKSINEIRVTVLGYVSQCYALEGEYPPDLAYLEQNYGLLLDRDKYIYHYELFAANIFPDVKVFAKQKAGGVA